MRRPCIHFGRFRSVLVAHPGQAKDVENLTDLLESGHGGELGNGFRYRETHRIHADKSLEVDIRKS